MFGLDTNVLSAVMGSHPTPRVAAWISAQPEERLFATSGWQAEILAGVEVMPDGRRRCGLEAAAKAIFADAFDGRILPFDAKSAEILAEIFAARRRAGKPTAITDLMTAAIARTQGANMVTRNTAEFEDCGLIVINPWAAL